MDDGTALCEEAALFLCLLVVEVCKECGDVAGEHLGCVPGYLALEFVAGEDDYAVVGNDFLRGIGAFDVAACGNSHINDDGAGLHSLDDVLLDEDRSLAAVA